MSDISFNEEQVFSQTSQFEPKNPKFAQMLIDWGLAKDLNSANIILISIAVVFFSISVFIFLRISGVFDRPSSNTKNPPPKGFPTELRVEP